MARGTKGSASASTPPKHPCAGNAPPLWAPFLARFDEILAECLPRHGEIVRALSEIVTAAHGTPNVLLYGARGFPLDLVYRAAIRRRFGEFHLRDHVHADGDIPYRRCGYFLEIDFAHPNLPKDLECLAVFLRDIVGARFAHAPRHIIVLRNIDALRDPQPFRVLLERFSHNAVFICTTHRVGALEPPLRSRFQHSRVPLPTAEETSAVLALLGAAPGAAPRCRVQFLKALYLAGLGDTGAGSGAGGALADYHFAPLAEFFAARKPTPSLEAIRAAAAAAYQANVPLARAAEDVARYLDGAGVARKAIWKFVAAAADLEHAFVATQKGRAPIYYEQLLHLGLTAAHR